MISAGSWASLVDAWERRRVDYAIRGGIAVALLANPRLLPVMNGRERSKWSGPTIQVA